MAKLPPGFRFYPTEEELVSFYLHNKLEGKRQELHHAVPVVNIYGMEPWHLPKFAGELCKGDTEQWFFFEPRQEREARGGRPNRTTATGYWKATGSPSYVYSLDNRVIGLKKSMVFYKGKAPTGRKTKWKMHEYRAIDGVANPTDVPKLRREFSLCRVYVVSGTFRAFDRRPMELEAMTRETQPQDVGAATTSSQNNMMVEKTSSPESSYSGGDRLDLPESAGSAYWEMANGIDPLWELEQLNWL